MDIKPENFEPASGDEPRKIEYSTFARFRGKLLKICFYALLALMSCGTLLIVLYAFMGRSLLG